LAVGCTIQRVLFFVMAGLVPAIVFPGRAESANPESRISFGLRFQDTGRAKLDWRSRSIQFSMHDAIFLVLFRA
jgi:hypothetical protein